MREIFLLSRIVLLILAFPSSVFAQTKNFAISSPDKNIKMLVSADKGPLTYAITFKGKPVVHSSSLGLVINGSSLGEQTSLGAAKSYKANERYAYRGVHSIATNNYNGAKLSIKDAATSFILEVRVFNDGVAWRYLVPTKDSAIVQADKTEFTIPQSSIIWSQPNIKYYEGKYSNKSIEQFKKDEVAGPPVTIELPGGIGYAAIVEGGLTDFGGMSLIANGNNGFRANLSGITRKKGTVETAWRIVEIGKDLNTLVNCDIIANVSPAYDVKLFPKGVQTSWVKPGRSVWSWLAKNRAVTLENMKRFSDMAAELGFEYNLVDEGWGAWKEGERNHWDMLKELVDYSAKKGVKIWVWKAYPERKGIPGIKNEAARREFFKKCKEIGVAGLKIDFFDSEDQEIINFYQNALRDAAQYQLMINFHGSNKPTGEARTWPNEMTREAVRGLENRAPWGPGNAVLPFTRYLAGHGDFTPVHFGDRQGDVSWAHHVASMVIYTSPFLCLGADPQDILNNPAKELIQSVPTGWDETIVLPASKIGELAAYARRKGNTWFVAVMNGGAAKQLKLHLNFLNTGSYQAYVLSDERGNQSAVEAKTSVVTSKNTINIDLNEAGGFVARLVKK